MFDILITITQVFVCKITQPENVNYQTIKFSKKSLNALCSFLWTYSNNIVTPRTIGFLWSLHFLFFFYFFRCFFFEGGGCEFVNGWYNCLNQAGLSIMWTMLFCLINKFLPLFLPSLKFLNGLCELSHQGNFTHCWWTYCMVKVKGFYLASLVTSI